MHQNSNHVTNSGNPIMTTDMHFATALKIPCNKSSVAGWDELKISFDITFNRTRGSCFFVPR